MSNPTVADNQPKAVTLEKGRQYAFCTCGKSNSQPFCDGSHSGTGIAPKVFRAEADGEAWLCQCKQTKNAPFCDGTHSQIPAEKVGRPFDSQGPE